MNHRIESLEIKSRQVPKVLANLRNVLEPFSKLATFKQVGIKADDFVARRVEHRHGDRSDITLVAGKQYLHQRSAPLGKWIKVFVQCVLVWEKRRDSCPQDWHRRATVTLGAVSREDFSFAASSETTDSNPFSCSKSAASRIIGNVIRERSAMSSKECCPSDKFNTQNRAFSSSSIDPPPVGR